MKNFLIIYILGTSIFFMESTWCQFIPPQLERASNANDGYTNKNASTEGLITFYVMLSQPYESFKNSKSYCDNLIKYGAIPPSQNYLQLMNSTYPKILKDINECSIRKTGKAITKKDIEIYKAENPDIARDFVDSLNVLSQMGGMYSAPKTRADLDKCQGDEMFLNLYLKTFQQISNYPDKNWCDTMTAKSK